jgi:hypothetical protein
MSNSELDPWREEDADWPLCDWQDDVRNNYTRLGYWDWVEHNKESSDSGDDASV